MGQEALGLLHTISSDSFWMPSKYITYFFGYTKGLSTLLQGSELSILTGFDEVETVKAELHDIGRNEEREFSGIYMYQTMP